MSGNITAYMESNFDRAIANMRQTLKSLKKSDGGPESEELVRKERKAETKKLKKQKKAKAKLAESTCTKGQALYMLSRANMLGRFTMAQSTAIAGVLDKSGPIISDPLVKLLKSAASSDLNADVTSLPYGDPNESSSPRIRNKGARARGKLGELSHPDGGIGQGVEHRNQRHSEDSFLTERQLFSEGSPMDSIEQAMGMRRTPLSAAPAGNFGAQSPAVLSSTLAGAEPQGSVRRRAFDVDREGEQAVHEPDQVGHVPGDTRPHVSGMSVPTADSEGDRSYQFWSTRHARMNHVSARELYYLAPRAVNDGRMTMEQSTALIWKCQHGQPISETLLRHVVDDEGKR